MAAAPARSRPEHPAQAPGVVIDGASRFAVRSATARIQRRALDLSPGDLRILVLADGAPFAALDGRGTSAADVVSVARDAGADLEPLTVERGLRRIESAELLDRVRRSGRNGAARFAPVEKPRDWRRIPVSWASLDPKVLRAMVACAFAKTGRDWEDWLAGDRAELIVNGTRARRGLRVWLHGERVRMTARKFAAALAGAPFPVRIVDERPVERLVRNGRPTVQKRSSDEAPSCVRYEVPGLDLRSSTTRADEQQNAIRPAASPTDGTDESPKPTGGTIHPDVRQFLDADYHGYPADTLGQQVENYLVAIDHEAGRRFLAILVTLLVEQHLDANGNPPIRNPVGWARTAAADPLRFVTRYEEEQLRSLERQVEHVCIKCGKRRPLLDSEAEWQCLRCATWALPGDHRAHRPSPLIPTERYLRDYGTEPRHFATEAEWQLDCINGMTDAGRESLERKLAEQAARETEAAELGPTYFLKLLRDKRAAEELTA